MPLRSGSSIPVLTPGTYVTIFGDKTSCTSFGGNVIYQTNPQMLLRTILGRIGLGPKYYCINLSSGEEEMGALLRWSAEGKMKPVLDREPWPPIMLDKHMVDWRITGLGEGMWLTGLAKKVDIVENENLSRASQMYHISIDITLNVGIS